MKGRGCVTWFLAGALGLWMLAGTAKAEPVRQGFYAGVELGFTNAADIESTVSGVNHPTQCDQLLKNVDPTNVVDLSDPACNVGDVPQPLSNTSLDLGVGFMGGFSVGYALDSVRLEFEYMNRSQGGDSVPWNIAAGNAPLQSKNSELSALDPPSERISNFNAHQFFVNAYYDFRNASRWTPYLGAGVGWARTSFDHGIRYVRRTLAQGYPADTKPPAAAGTISLLETEMAETLFGFQVLGGLDYALTEHVALGMKARWASFQDMQGDARWTLIRGHEPVRADGTTPFTTRQVFDNLHYWGMTFGLKYYF